MLKIRWHGHACFEITNDLTLVTDPHDGKSIGIPTPNVHGDIILISHDHFDHSSGVKLVEKQGCKIVSDPRKKNISNVEITGFESFHDENFGAKRGSNIIYKFIMDGIKFCHLGDLGHELDDNTVEKIGDVDILFIPVGGNFTIDDKKAWNIIKKIKPKIIVPMHYKIGGLSLSIAGIEPFLEQSKYKVIHVGNEIDLEYEDIPSEPEIWTFTL
ncbi:MAG: MBL fold metallo-hydrolase [Candidatus Thermoplasmatota archaeon]|jgi:L-ascorbate metabolism protein UlaG (beta-lactamase superfamily)|nr:MBL fold metallo-hydrolase [Candidatus Thermoplasmatota archaeon]